MTHGIVYAKDGVFAGWPANHGAWQWKDEFLVGFLVGEYRKGMGMHNCGEPFRKLQARSLDGGETWTMEEPNVDFNADIAQLNTQGATREEMRFPKPPPFSPNAIIRVSGCYDHGGEHCAEEGGFYVSSDRGKTWQGAYRFFGLSTQFSPPFNNTSRTAVLDDLVFLSRNVQDHFGTDETFVARWAGREFKLLSFIIKDEARAVMPAVAQTKDRIVCALRRRRYHRRDCWIDAFGSQDGGQTWKFLSQVDSTGGYNGNPPALLALPDGRLVCAYANRSEQEIRVRISEDGGETWSVPHITLRRGTTDIGYPRLFLREDGDVVCVYYFAKVGQQQHIAWTRFEP